MKTTTTAANDKGFRFPSEMISHAVWLYFRFSLSFGAVEELLAQRGMVVTSETVGQWYLKFGQTDAHEWRSRRPRCGDTWQRDEVVLTIGGRWIRTATCSTSSSRGSATKQQPQDFSVSSSKGYNPSRASSVLRS